MDLSQIKVGIENLDALLQGGFIRGSTVVLCGPVGTLKSHIGFHFIYSGLVNGEKCFCFSTNQDLDVLALQLKINYGWDLKRYVDTGMLDFLYYSPASVQISRLAYELSGTEIVREIVHRVGDDVSRIVVNTLSQLFTVIGDEGLVLSLIYRLKAKVGKSGAVALFIMDSKIQRESIEENVKSIADYVLETRVHEDVMHEEVVEIRLVKSLTRHDLKWHRVYLAENGVHVE
ncbi:MAG: RAD55 family ATPase [Candidatus Bathyarchaeia archaeon]